MKRGRRIPALLLAAALLIQPVWANEEPEGEDPEIWEAVEALSSLEDVAGAVGGAVLMERETRTCLYESGGDERLPIASVTKVMTLLLIAEQVERGELRPEDTLTCSAYAASMGGSQIFLQEGERMTVEDLVKAVAVSSANDVAVLLAEASAGSESAFVQRMNRRAEELGMTNTLYANCTGLPCEGEHYSSARDVALLSCRLLEQDWIRGFTTIWTDSVRDGEFGLSNTNKLIRFYPGATGLKTGFTQEAMYCLSASACRDGTEFVAVILHAPTSAVRFESAKLLLDHAFANYSLVELLPDGALPPVPVRMGAEAWVQPELQGETKLVVEKSRLSGLRKETALAPELEAPVRQGETLGSLRLVDGDGRELAAAVITAGADVARQGWRDVLLRCLRLLFTGRDGIFFRQRQNSPAS